jgi:YggT family protein
MSWLALAIDWVIRLYLFIVLVYVVLGYFLSPWHPVRQTLARFIEPLLAPIRKILPAAGPVDFSPVVLMLALLVFNQIVQGLLRMF